MAFDMNELFDSCEEEIANLMNVRNALSAAGAKSKKAPLTNAVKTGKRGRPVGSKSSMAGVKTAMKKATATPAKKAVKNTGRKLSEAGRKAISDAMKRRWAERAKSKK